MDLNEYREKLKQQTLDTICERIWAVSKLLPTMTIIKKYYINSNIEYARRKYNIRLTENEIRIKLEEKAKKFNKKLSFI